MTGFGAFVRNQRGILVAGLVLVGFLVAMPLVSGAAPGPYSRAKVTCSPKTLHAGDTTTVTGSGFPANSPTTVTIDGTTPLGLTTTNASGSFTTTVLVPATTSKGNHTIDATVTYTGGSVTKSCAIKVI